MQPDSDIIPENARISDLVDGRLAGAEFEAALSTLAHREARECWHVYQLIGDVLRAPELAAWDRGADVLPDLGESGLRAARAAALPDPTRPAANDAVFRWKLVAGLASFAAVAVLGWGALAGLAPAPGGAQLALQQPAPDAAAGAERTPRPVLADASVAGRNTVMLRDPELDRLLAAHQQSSGVAAFGNPSGFLRSATFEGSGR
ncbi:MAG TPA: sigma-E factor negative regulatory protein [Ottowia sp.]|uniref:sigma-E factor negative regulatory protein n=1 Tax=Ottowia sp. TaxID=1898956 RepID=UPI002BC3CF32|nr:sigma-E factor negative regulatory protein [Ottowia sp.]HMN20466.1 sigma-E factor negative regulatory protein [Ottowia sp.]